MATNTMTTADLQSNLAHFSGGGKHYRHWTKRIVYTEGVQYLAEQAGAYWLIDLIASHQHKAKLRLEEFQVWILTVNRTPPQGKPMAYARCFPDTPEPGNANQLCVQGISYTDFPLDEIKLWLVNGVLMLPSEY